MKEQRPLHQILLDKSVRSTGFWWLFHIDKNRRWEQWFVMVECGLDFLLEVIKLDLVECSKDEGMACDGRMWQYRDWKKPYHFLDVLLHVTVLSLHDPRGRASAGVAELGSCSNVSVVLNGGRRWTSRRGQLVAVKTTRPSCDVSVWLLIKRGRGKRVPDSTEETRSHWEPCCLPACVVVERAAETVDGTCILSFDVGQCRSSKTPVKMPVPHSSGWIIVIIYFFYYSDCDGKIRSLIVVGDVDL